MLLHTSGADFILDWLATNDEPVISLDKRTYAGNCEKPAELTGDETVRKVAPDLIEAIPTSASPTAARRSLKSR